MSKAQTIFSELCVASAIGDSVRVEDIENVDEATAAIYRKELSLRQSKANGISSINALLISGKAIRKYLLDNGVTPKPAGQPEVLLSFRFKTIATKEEFPVDLKIEIRWSHGKFCGNPEAKVYKTWSYSALPWAENICP